MTFEQHSEGCTLSTREGFLKRLTVRRGLRAYRQSPALVVRLPASRGWLPLRSPTGPQPAPHWTPRTLPLLIAPETRFSCYTTIMLTTSSASSDDPTEEVELRVQLTFAAHGAKSPDIPPFPLFVSFIFSETTVKMKSWVGGWCGTVETSSGAAIAATKALRALESLCRLHVVLSGPCACKPRRTQHM